MNLIISKQTRRRFIMGKQGLYPGRRWMGKHGAEQAMNAGAVVQIDPLCIVARSHDLALFSRVIDYSPDLLNSLCYTDRRFFDYGGTVMVYPMRELPYFRAVFERKQQEPRWTHFAEQNPDTVAEVLAAIREKGPLGTRDFSGPAKRASWRSGKAHGQTLYYLWLSGELMTHSRHNFQRIFDLRERVAPPDHNTVATTAESEDFFALRLFDHLNLVNFKSWRAWFAGAIERKVSPEEATGRLNALLAAGKVVEVWVEDDPKVPRYICADDLPLLETLHTGRIPDTWQPLQTSTDEEVTFLAPLEIVSARGRAKQVFDFEYLWEVYKPRELRRWGYYTLPILYGDRLVARFDPECNRKTRTLLVHGFWIEPDVALDAALLSALAKGFTRFARFLQVDQIAWEAGLAAEVGERLNGKLTI